MIIFIITLESKYFEICITLLEQLESILPPDHPISPTIYGLHFKNRVKVEIEMGR